MDPRLSVTRTLAGVRQIEIAAVVSLFRTSPTSVILRHSSALSLRHQTTITGSGIVTRTLVMIMCETSDSAGAGRFFWGDFF